MDYEQEIINFYQKIKRQWLYTTRHGDQCLGNAFEDFIGKEEDNLSEADYHGIELKSHRESTTSLMSLFSKSPSSPRGVNTYLREKYGVEEEESGKLVLNTTISGDKFNTHRGGHGFKIDVDRENNKMWLVVKTLESDVVLESKNNGKLINWDFNVLTTALERKLSKIAFLYGEEKDEDGKHYVKFNKMCLFEGLTLEKMLSALEVGDLLIDIRIGVYASGSKKGKTHDHGTAFRINLDKLLEKYGNVRWIE